MAKRYTVTYTITPIGTQTFLMQRNRRLWWDTLEEAQAAMQAILAVLGKIYEARILQTDDGETWIPIAYPDA